MSESRLLDLSILALGVLALALLGVVNGYMQFVFGLVAIWTILCTGLNVLFGLTGLVSLGQVGFFAVGAYAHAILSQAGATPDSSGGDGSGFRQHQWRSGGR